MQGKGIVNSISLKEGEADFLERPGASSATAPAWW
jgi:cobalamin-dependent methionine synthase I